MKTYISIYCEKSLVEKIDQRAAILERKRNPVIVRALEEFISKQLQGVKAKSK